MFFRVLIIVIVFGMSNMFSNVFANDKPVIMLEGDTIAKELGNSFEKQLNTFYGDKFDVYKGGLDKGSCLYQEFGTSISHLIKELSPEIVILSTGYFDDIAIALDEETIIAFSDPRWAAVYADKLDSIIDILSTKKARVVVIAPPLSGPKKKRIRLKKIRGTIKAVCENRKIICLDPWRSMTNQGADSIYIKLMKEKKTNLNILNKDGLHLTPAGSFLLSGQIMPEIINIIEKDKK